MNAAELPKRAPVFPLVIEDRIALDYLGRTVTGLSRFERLTLSPDQIRNALDAAFQAGVRFATQPQETATPKATGTDDGDIATALGEAHRLLQKLGYEASEIKGILESDSENGVLARITREIARGRSPQDAASIVVRTPASEEPAS